MSALEAALRCAEHGWPVLPCEPEGKRPATRHGLCDATTDQTRIASWWRSQPNANLAVTTGRPSGIVVLDVDGEEGWDSLHALEDEYGELPETTSVTTPRGGQHFYFGWPGALVKTSAGDVAPGLDIRGDGGYVLVPPSSVDRRGYEVDERCGIAGMPGWLLERTGRTGAQDGTAQPAETWVRMVSEGVAEGSRNQSMARLVGHLLRKYVDVDLVAMLAHLTNETRWRPPLPSGEVDQIIDSIARTELRRRQGRTS